MGSRRSLDAVYFPLKIWKSFAPFSRVADKSIDGDVDRMVEMTQPDFGNFMWDLPAEHLAEAHRKWEAK